VDCGSMNHSRCKMMKERSTSFDRRTHDCTMGDGKHAVREFEEGFIVAVGNRAYQQYRNASVMTASQDKLLIMLYDGLIQKMKLAQRAIEGNNLIEAHTQLVKCQNIILELRNSLKMEYEISHALSSLYDYYYRRLVEANVQKSVQPIEEILPRIEELREAWVQASIKVRTMSFQETQENS